MLIYKIPYFAKRLIKIDNQILNTKPPLFIQYIILPNYGLILNTTVFYCPNAYMVICKQIFNEGIIKGCALPEYI